MTLNGVVIDGQAPVQAILGAYTIAAFDDCGGHLNPVAGYHLHGAANCSEGADPGDGDTPPFAYAIDGFPIHSPLTADQAEAADLDACNGHTSEASGYHYHANRPEVNAVLSCLMGATAASSSARGGAPDERPRPAAPDESATGYLGSYTLDDAEFGTQVTVTLANGVRRIDTNALPNHETGEFPNPGNPNTISAQHLTYEYPSEPTFTGDATTARTPGVAVNGLKFEPATAETVTCESGETYRVEALQDLFDLGLDFNNAHVQPTGEYHYHGISELLADAYATDDDLVLIGFAADGYLMYYSKSGAYASGYALSTEARTGVDCTGSGALQSAAVAVDGTNPDGTYASDWIWSDTTGDLDSCNGATIGGTYAYVVTDDYPFVSRCLNGEFTASGPGGGPPPGGDAENARPDGGAAPGAGQDLTEAAATLGVSVDELMAALGPPPPDIDAAAETLGVSADELRAALPAPPTGG